MLQTIRNHASHQRDQSWLRWLLLLFVLATLVIGYSSYYRPKPVRAYSTYSDKIPNYGQGSMNGNGCAACHGGSLAMKAPFANAGHTWTAALAFMDSDQDGFTNGEELQDPTGVWTSGGSGTASAVRNPSDANDYPAQAQITALNGLVTGSSYSGTVNLSVMLNQYVGARIVTYELLDTGQSVVSSFVLATANGVNGGYTPNATPFNLVWDTSNSPNGVYTMRATLTDAKSRTSQHSITNITINNPAATNGTRYIAKTGTDSGDCKNAAAPCKTPLYALDKAVAGDELRIAAGTYVITPLLGLNLTSPLTITGGFSTSNWQTPNAASNPTILDGGQEGHVVFVPGGANGSIIQHLTIQNSISAYIGVSVNGAPIMIRNCIFRNNHSSARGGALQVLGGRVEISDSRFENNSSDNDGGAIWAVGPLTVTNSQFISNFAQFNGGAIHIGENGDSLNGLFATENLFSNNRAAGNGGAINLGFVIAELEKNRFLNNRADGKGGALNSGGPGFKITNSLFAHNDSSHEGAVIATAYADRVTLTHVTIAGSGVTTSALAFDNTNFGTKPIQLVNTLVSGYAKAVYFKARAADGATLTWQNSLVTEDVSTLVENVNASPVVGAPLRAIAGFVDANNGNYRLAFGAPAIDMASNSVGVTTDLDGNSRSIGTQPDIGAYEFQGPAGAIQLNNSGYTPVQNSSFQVFVQLSQAAATTITVRLNSTAGSAQTGVDYTEVNQVLTFAPGQLQRSIMIQILNSGALSDRTFTLTLSEPSGGAVLGSPNGAIVTIAGINVPTATPTAVPPTSLPTPTATPTVPPGSTATSPPPSGSTATNTPTAIGTPIASGTPVVPSDSTPMPTPNGTNTPAPNASATPTMQPGATRAVYLPVVTK